MACTDLSALSEQNRKHLATIEALQNLFYLIRVDAHHPERVKQYVEQADYVVAQLRGGDMVH
jgi:fibrillarin-like rRNA methylase